MFQGQCPQRREGPFLPQQWWYLYDHIVGMLRTVKQRMGHNCSKPQVLNQLHTEDPAQSFPKLPCWCLSNFTKELDQGGASLTEAGVLTRPWGQSPLPKAGFITMTRSGAPLGAVLHTIPLSQQVKGSLSELYCEHARWFELGESLWCGLFGSTITSVWWDFNLLGEQRHSLSKFIL